MTGVTGQPFRNLDRDADDVVEKLRGHVLAGNRLPTVWVPDQQTRDDRELIRTRLELDAIGHPLLELGSR